jgi:serine/threonine-protein kinase SRPK3
MMNGEHLKKAAIQKAKQVANAAANGNGQKKRRKGTDLKPIITNENQQASDSSAMSTTVSASINSYVGPLFR